MREAAEVSGSILFLIASWALRVAWGILKIAVFVAILWGAVKGVSNTSLPLIGDLVSWAKSTTPTFFGATFLLWIAENWLTFAILLVFLNSVSSRWILEELSTTGGYTRIFIGTVMNYFRVETETHSLKKIREAGMWAAVKDGMTERIVTRILGIELPDERLSAKAVRHGQEVHLADDVKETIGSDTKKDDSDDR